MDPNQQPPTQSVPPASPYPQPPTQQPYPQQPGAAGEDPGRTLAIIGLVLSFVVAGPLIGLIICIIANNKSKQAGYKNSIATAGIWIDIVLLVLFVLAISVGIIAGIAGSKS